MFTTIARKPTVIIQVSAYLPKMLMVEGKERPSRKRYLTWVSVGRHPLLYCDRENIIVRQFGSVSIYVRDGSMRSAGYKLDHPNADRIPYRPRNWRVHPDSVAQLRGCSTINLLRKKT